VRFQVAENAGLLNILRKYGFKANFALIVTISRDLICQNICFTDKFLL
jgi:hypothetical protein